MHTCSPWLELPYPHLTSPHPRHLSMTSWAQPAAWSPVSPSGWGCPSTAVLQKPEPGSLTSGKAESLSFLPSDSEFRAATLRVLSLGHRDHMDCLDCTLGTALGGGSIRDPKKPTLANNPVPRKPRPGEMGPDGRGGQEHREGAASWKGL